MTAPRSASLIAVQAAISATVRPQPTQSAERGSMTQTLTQGVDIVGADMTPNLGGGMADEKPAPRGDLGALLRGAGDVAGLPADLPLSDEDNGQCADAAGQSRDKSVRDPQRDEAKRESDDEA